MKPNLPQAKILQHCTGLGAPDSEIVRRRAAELAEIAGRRKPNDQDWRAAKRELHGGHESLNHNGDEHMAALVSERDMVAGSVGHHIPNIVPEDTDNLAEELYVEGMDEAEHEQMLEARRRERDEEEEEEE
jgi:hypothetical protein